MYKIPCSVYFEWCRFLVNVPKSTLAKWECVCMKGLRSPNRDIRLSRNQTLAVSEHANRTGHYPLWDEVKFIGRDPHWYSHTYGVTIINN